MAYSFPLSTADFITALPIAEMMFDAPPAVQMDQTAGGEQLTSDRGPALWSGQISLVEMTQSENDLANAMLDILGPAGRSFYAFDSRRPAPLADPTGLVLGARVVTIASLNVNNRELALTGLPAWYLLSRGDYLAFDYGPSIRRALHRIVSVSAQASSAGTTPQFEVYPLIRPGAANGAVVTLIRAACKAELIRAKTNKGRSYQTITNGVSFAFVQTLKGV